MHDKHLLSVDEQGIHFIIIESKKKAELMQLVQLSASPMQFPQGELHY
jgi:hypothetical protein